MKALIVNENRIAQVEQDANIFDVVQEWQWVDCPSNCTLEWTYDGNKFYEPVIAPPSKDDLLASITVTTQSGKTFDGNETARNNMLSAIQSADIIGQTESHWKLADNTVALITLNELKEALALSIQKVGEIVLSQQ